MEFLSCLFSFSKRLLIIIPFPDSLLAAVLAPDYGKIFYTWPFALKKKKKDGFCFIVCRFCEFLLLQHILTQLQFTCWHHGSYQTLTGLVHTRGPGNTFYLFPRCRSHIPPLWPKACMQTRRSTKGPVYLFIKALCVNICRTASPSIE